MEFFPIAAALSPILAWFALAATLAGQTIFPDSFQSLLPADAKIIETTNLTVGSRRTRALVLWMRDPQRVTASWDTCSDSIYSDHWFGPTRLSLIDTSNRKLVDTVPIRSSHEVPNGRGGLAVPFFTSNPPYYVPHPGQDGKGKPLLLNLRDLTGEGVAGQFANQIVPCNITSKS